jgi:hypothetical protein
MLTKRLAVYPGVVAVAEPTSMSWLPLAAAVSEASGQLALIGSRHAARLRGAITGKNKSDVIDADVLARAGEVFDLVPLWAALRFPDCCFRVLLCHKLLTHVLITDFVRCPVAKP